MRDIHALLPWSLDTPGRMPPSSFPNPASARSSHNKTTHLQLFPTNLLSAASNPFAMSLPLPEVQSAVDCASFDQTVLPFLSQLTSLPTALQEAGRDLVALKEIYLATNPFITALTFCLASSALFLAWSEINRNYSQVDRCWSLLPAVYNVHYAVWARMAGVRTLSLDTIAVVSVIWSVSSPFHTILLSVILMLTDPRSSA